VPPEEDAASAKRYLQDGGFGPEPNGVIFLPQNRGIMPNYEDDVRNAKKTAERFERLYELRAKEAEASEDKQTKGNLLFGNWMISRRIGRFRYFYECQLAGRHEVAYLINGKEVCTCGLIAKGGGGVAGADGHL
jgi:hypothetical protein